MCQRLDCSPFDLEKHAVRLHDWADFSKLSETFGPDAGVQEPRKIQEIPPNGCFCCYCWLAAITIMITTHFIKQKIIITSCLWKAGGLGGSSSPGKVGRGLKGKAPPRKTIKEREKTSNNINKYKKYIWKTKYFLNLFMFSGICLRIFEDLVGNDESYKNKPTK